MPAIVSLIAVTYSGKQRALAFGIVGGVAGAAIAAGPLIGGWVTTEFSWRYVFAGEVVIVVAILLLRRRLPAPPAIARRPKLDVVGVAISRPAWLGLVGPRQLLLIQGAGPAHAAARTRLRSRGAVPDPARARGGVLRGSREGGGRTPCRRSQDRHVGGMFISSSPPRVVLRRAAPPGGRFDLRASGCSQVVHVSRACSRRLLSQARRPAGSGRRRGRPAPARSVELKTSRHRAALRGGAAS